MCPHLLDLRLRWLLSIGRLWIIAASRRSEGKTPTFAALLLEADQPPHERNTS